MADRIADRMVALRERISHACGRAGRAKDDVRVIAVTKTHPAETLQAVIDAGIRDIGENRVQEVIEKVPRLHGERVVHMVGHLQTNKVGKVVPLADWIQSVDSEKLLNKISEACAGAHRKMNLLVQVNTSGENTKSGVDPVRAVELCEHAANTPNVVFRGLMTIGPLWGGEKETRESFALLRGIGEQCAVPSGRIELSMGMSGDFEMAIEEGATMIRVGSLLLGNRGY